MRPAAVRFPVQPDGKSRWQISNEKCIRAGRPVLMPHAQAPVNPVVCLRVLLK
jgi:hypothetical protein